MDKEELYKDIEDTLGASQKYFGLSWSKFFIMVFIVVAFGVYLGILLYGSNSVEVLMGLQEYEVYLQDETFRLKNENAELQREYFELKEISAQ